MKAPNSSQRRIASASLSRHWHAYWSRRVGQERPWTRVVVVVLAAMASTCVLALVFSLLFSSYYRRFFHASAMTMMMDPWMSFFFPRSNSPEFRVFGPASSTSSTSSSIYTRTSSTTTTSTSSAEDSSTTATLIQIDLFTREEQRAFLRDYGHYCQASFDTTASSNNLLLERFEALSEEWGIELWKYCRLYTGLGNVYWNPDLLVPLVEWEDILYMDMDDNEDNSKKKKSYANMSPLALEIQDAHDTVRDSSSHQNYEAVRLSPSFLALPSPKSRVAVNMMRVLVETPAVALDAWRLSELLGLYVVNDKQLKKKKTGAHDQQQQQTKGVFQLFTARCQWTGDSDYHHLRLYHHRDSASSSLLPPGLLVEDHHQRHPLPKLPHHCPLLGGACCQVWLPESSTESYPVLVLKEPYLTTTTTTAATAATNNNSNNRRPFVDTKNESELVMPVEDLPFIATIQEVPTDHPPTTRSMTPNFFDILAENNCLPEGRECFKCLKHSNGCNNADQNAFPECRCYCGALCRIRPPPKRISAEWLVQLPRYHLSSSLIPRMVHQTWYEPITKEKYPNMSRLIESWRQSGWKYYFYNDEQAAQFLSTHFPPQVRQAYDAVIPGAFKADLFRYCVLLIRGGVYADMDVLLESNLDELLLSSSLGGNVGFVTAQDEPGTEAGHRSCLWNGLLASAPGHPFLMETIQNVVNGIQNRYTSVDYDDLLCPNPDLSVSHTIDMLFTCGPCILGKSINQVLNRHPQTSFEYGEIDLFETERRLLQEQQQQQQQEGSASSLSSVPVRIDADDLRWLIPGRSILLQQDKQDMGAHRFTLRESNKNTDKSNKDGASAPALIVASTDLPDSDDRPKSLVHYSKTHESFGIYGLSKLYINDERTNEEIRIRMDVL